jgi:hypothetical protein
MAERTGSSITLTMEVRLRSACDALAADWRVSRTPPALHSRSAVAQYGSMPAAQCRWLCSQ